MIRGLLITTVVSFFISVACLVGSAALGGAHWGGKNWSFSSENTCTWSEDGKTKTCTTTAGEVKAGTKTSRDFAWSGGDSLTISAPARVRYRQGAAGTVTVSGPESVLERVVFENGEISLSGRGSAKGLSISIEAPNVSSFRFNGGQKVEIEDYAQDILRIEGNGAVDLDAEGTARRIELRMNGASNADLDDVINEEARVELNGASNASLAPRTSVDIRINGVGNVSLGSRPAQITKEIHGVGGVSYRTAREKAPSEPSEPSEPPAPRGAARDI